MEDISVKRGKFLTLAYPRPYSAKDIKNILETQGRGKVWKQVEKANGNKAELFNAHPNTTAAFVVELKDYDVQNIGKVMDLANEVYGKTVVSIFDNTNDIWFVLVIAEENRKAKRYIRALTDKLAMTLTENDIKFIGERDGQPFLYEKMVEANVPTDKCHSCYNFDSKCHEEKENDNMPEDSEEQEDNRSFCFSDLDTKMRDIFAQALEKSHEAVKKETKKMVKREITNGIGKALAFAAVNGQKAVEVCKSTVQDISESYREEKNEMEKESEYHQATKEEHSSGKGYFDSFFDSIAREVESAASDITDSYKKNKSQMEDERMDNMPHRKDEIPRLQGRANTYDLIVSNGKELVEAYYLSGEWFSAKNNEHIDKDAIVMYTKHIESEVSHFYF